eukprot:11679454-Alexandrium_andersonii.AAC.1
MLDGENRISTSRGQGREGRGGRCLGLGSCVAPLPITRCRLITRCHRPSSTSMCSIKLHMNRSRRP